MLLEWQFVWDQNKGDKMSEEFSKKFNEGFSGKKDAVKKKPEDDSGDSIASQAKDLIGTVGGGIKDMAGDAYDSAAELLKGKKKK